MIEKVGHVRNPLTIIAIFAALAEVGGTAVLPLLDPVTQYIYVWFLMLFPIALVGLFFYVLYHKHHVLYAPSDFKEDTAFLDLLEAQSASDRVVSLQEESKAVDRSEEASDLGEESAISALKIVERDYRGKYLLAEELAVAKIAKERNLDVRRNVAERGTSDGGFDGAAESESYDYIIEVAYTRRSSIPAFWRQKFDRLSHFYAKLPGSRRNRFRAIFAIVHDRGDEQRAVRAVDVAKNLASELPFAVDLVTYCYEDLADEFELR